MKPKRHDSENDHKVSYTSLFIGLTTLLTAQGHVIDNRMNQSFKNLTDLVIIFDTIVLRKEINKILESTSLSF